MFFYYLLTQRCNLACGHCIRGDSVQRDMDPKLALQFMSDLAHYEPRGTLVLTGGEPTLYPEFMLLLCHALQLFDGVILTSNGTTPLFAKEVDSWLALHAAGLQIQFSIDGDEQAHDRLRGAGSWRSAMEHLELLSRVGIPMWFPP